MRARDIMSSPVTTIDQARSVGDCLREIARSGFSALPVVDEQKRLVGIVSEGDLLRSGFERLSQEHATESTEQSVADVMTQPVVAMTEDVVVNDIASESIGHDIHMNSAQSSAANSLTGSAAIWSVSCVA